MSQSKNFSTISFAIGLLIGITCFSNANASMRGRDDEMEQNKLKRACKFMDEQGYKEAVAHPSKGLNILFDLLVAASKDNLPEDYKKFLDSQKILSQLFETRGVQAEADVIKNLLFIQRMADLNGEYFWQCLKDVGSGKNNFFQQDIESFAYREGSRKLLSFLSARTSNESARISNETDILKHIKGSDDELPLLENLEKLNADAVNPLIMYKIKKSFEAARKLKK